MHRNPPPKQVTGCRRSHSNDVPFFFVFQGQAFFLNDGRSVMSLNNALMWAKVNAFSLVGSGVRLEPF